jgi:hypothetical protein
MYVGNASWQGDCFCSDLWLKVSKHCVWQWSLNPVSSFHLQFYTIRIWLSIQTFKMTLEQRIQESLPPSRKLGCRQVSDSAERFLVFKQYIHSVAELSIKFYELGVSSTRCISSTKFMEDCWFVNSYTDDTTWRLVIHLWKYGMNKKSVQKHITLCSLHHDV